MITNSHAQVAARRLLLAIFVLPLFNLPTKAVEELVAPSPRDVPADKSQYHLFHPTPRELMREMETDRPDLTESPITVDAGHFQVEMDLFAFSYDRDTTDQGDTRVISYGIAPINLKVGLLNHLDAQLILETWTIRRIEDRVTGRVINQSGFGDVIPRLKLNLWGNDGGRTAAAIMPFVKIPTNQDRLGNNAFEGGLIVPFGVELPKEFGLGLMAEVDVIQDESGNGYHPEFINTIAIGHSIVGNLGAYIEFFSLVSTEAEADWIGSVDVGFGYSFTPDVRLDAGVNIGVTPATDDWNPFVGISFRY